MGETVWSTKNICDDPNIVYYGFYEVFQRDGMQTEKGFNRYAKVIYKMHEHMVALSTPKTIRSIAAHV